MRKKLNLTKKQRKKYIKQKTHIWYIKNRKRLLEKDRKYRKKHHKQILKAHKIYNDAHLEERRLYRMRESREWSKFLLKNPKFTPNRWKKYQKERQELLKEQGLK
jgi:hypothetical protein